MKSQDAEVDGKNHEIIRDGNNEDKSSLAYNPNVYHDYSMTRISRVVEDPGSEATGAKKKESTFPKILHKILSNPKYKHIITWLPHGCSWSVLDHKEFEEEVIPLYFRHRNFASFMRQVNGWGFRRVHEGADRNSYYHKFFMKESPQLCTQMQRVTSNQKRKKALPTSVPDFYEIGFRYPLPHENIDTNDNRSLVPISKHFPVQESIPGMQSEQDKESEYHRNLLLLNNYQNQITQNHFFDQASAIQQHQMLLSQGVSLPSFMNGIGNAFSSYAPNIDHSSSTLQLRLVENKINDILSRRSSLFPPKSPHAYSYADQAICMGQSSQALPQLLQQDRNIRSVISNFGGIEGFYPNPDNHA